MSISIVTIMRVISNSNKLFGFSYSIHLRLPLTVYHFAVPCLSIMLCFYLVFTEVKKKVDILSDEYLKANVTRRIATVWENVGLYLEIHSDDLSTIKQFTNPIGDKCRQMLLIWLKRNQADASKSPTWKNMYKAMCSLDMIRPAEILQEELLQKYPNIN